MAQLQGFGIKDFYQTAVTRGFARTNTFRIKNITGVFNGEDSDLLLFAQGGTIPSRNIYYSSVSFKAFDFNVPMNSSYPESTSWSVNFYCDSDFILRDVLESWSRRAFDEHKHISTTSLSDIEFVLLDGYLRETRNYKLIGCYPTQVGSMSFSVGNAGELATCNVNIAFQYVISDNSI
jgi:hypothetical protein